MNFFLFSFFAEKQRFYEILRINTMAHFLAITHFPVSNTALLVKKSILGMTRQSFEADSHKLTQAQQTQQTYANNAAYVRN